MNSLTTSKMFKKKPVIKVGAKEWQVLIPRPPDHATHAELKCDDGKKATMPLKDFGCFKGVTGWFTYLRMDNRGKISKKHKQKWYWDGKQVEGIEKLMEE